MPQVENHLICSPFSVAQLALYKWPEGLRRKMNSMARRPRQLGLHPLDGITLPEDTTLRPTGRWEFPHFIFLISLHPLMARE